MKKTNLFLAAVIVCGMAVGSNANAQTTKNISFLMDTRSLETALNMVTPSATINDRAVRDFKQTYPNVDGEKWHSFKDGFAATFSENSVGYMITYNRVGDRLYTVSNYSEKQLPTAVRALVKSTYYDYTITLVQEINFHNQTVYLVHMQDETTWKNITVADGQMEVFEEYNKN